MMNLFDLSALFIVIFINQFEILNSSKRVSLNTLMYKLIVAYFKKEANPSLPEPPLNLIRGLTKRGSTSISHDIATLDLSAIMTWASCQYKDCRFGNKDYHYNDKTVVGIVLSL